MTAVLLVGRSLLGGEEQIRTESGCRITTVLDGNDAARWLESRSADGVVLSAELPSAQLILLAQQLVSHREALEVFIAGEACTWQVADPALLKVNLCTGTTWLPDLCRELKLLHEQRSRKPLDCEVVVVEDLDAPRDIICSYVESLGMNTVHGCTGAEDALRYLATPAIRPRIVITDIRMPDVDGCELIRKLRRHHTFKDLPVIALTAHGTIDCLVDALAAGASGFLVKPPKRAQLARELARACRIVEGTRTARLATPQEAERLRTFLG